MSALCLYGGWGSAKVARLYAKAPAAWEFHRWADLPAPARSGTQASATRVAMPTIDMFLKWIRKEIAYSSRDDAGGLGRPRPQLWKRARSAEIPVGASDSSD